MNNLTLIIALLILLTAIATNVFVDPGSDEPDEVTEASNEPDMYMLNATITQFNELGSLQHKIRADRFTHFPLTDMTTLRSPELRLFSTVPPWDIDSENGRLLGRSNYREEVMELWDNVEATQQREGGNVVNITTEALTVYPGREYAETQTPVQISDRTGTTNAAGMQAFFEQGRYVFYSTPVNRVRTVLFPAALPPIKD